ncbi:hypothetical protein RUM44_007319 [Polyplax serrata]|uniref:Uncharacterized protein n=1 Tax=Polyplax serrata TaxID=468196 RepID=A0ABR1B266_POLSC
MILQTFREYYKKKKPQPPTVTWGCEWDGKEPTDCKEVSPEGLAPRQQQDLLGNALLDIGWAVQTHDTLQAESFSVRTGNRDRPLTSARYLHVGFNCRYL